MKKYWLSTITLAVFLILPNAASSATLTAGDLVKLPDDGNPATSADAAVYYYGADAKRYVFPSDKAFFTWYENFDSVKTIDASAMAALSLGGNVTYRPGIRMVKIVSDPKVYVIAKNGTLRPIANEATAIALYGVKWNTLIDDISDAFFVNYRIGEEVTSAASYNPASESSISPNIGADKSLGDTVATVPDIPDMPTSDDEPNFTIDALNVPSQGPFVSGSSDVTFGVFLLKASTTSVNIVERLKFVGYVDERDGVLGFSEHLDNDDGVPTFAHKLVGPVGLYDAFGVELSAPRGLNSGSVLEFSSLNIDIQPGQTFEVHLKGEVEDNIDGEQLSDFLAFDIKNLATDVSVSDSSGSVIPAVGVNPNGGLTATHYIELVGSGTAQFEWKGENGNVIAGRESLIGELLVTVTGEDFRLEQLSLRTLGLLSSIASYRLEYTKSDDTTENVTQQYLGNLTTISHLDFVLEKERTNSIKVYITLFARNNNFYNEHLQIEVLDTDPMIFRSAVTGKFYDDAVFTTHAAEFSMTGVKADVYVRFSKPTFSLLDESPAGPIGKSQNTEIFRFRITAAPEGGVRIKHLTFKLEPGDTETSGANNDALEKWADVNGDGMDDNDLVNLYQISPLKEDPIGEDQSARLKYSIVDDGTKNDAPSEVISTSNDYALVEYDFVHDQEIKVAAGTSVDLRFEIDTSKFAIGSHSLSVMLLGESDMQWTDLYTGNYPIISGEIIEGLELVGHGLIVE